MFSIYKLQVNTNIFKEKESSSLTEEAPMSYTTEHPTEVIITIDKGAPYWKAHDDYDQREVFNPPRSPESTFTSL